MGSEWSIQWRFQLYDEQWEEIRNKDKTPDEVIYDRLQNKTLRKVKMNHDTTILYWIKFFD